MCINVDETIANFHLLNVDETIANFHLLRSPCVHSGEFI